tara:strand:- start:34123 stop:35712 length:1590 start_codon:yes stop_codon:yes gene_type:complete
MMKTRVLITCTGKGERLGNLTKYTNKSLVSVGDKLAIGRIIDNYPKGMTIVITLGYYGDHVRQYCKIAYPDRDFIFVDVDNYENDGSSLAYSMLCAHEHLQCPFIFNACDTIVDGPIPAVDATNWIGVVKKLENTSLYSTVSADTSGNVVKLHLKNSLDRGDYAHIGLIGVFDYSVFWDKMRQIYNADVSNPENNDVKCLEECIKEGYASHIHEFSQWYDVGSFEILVDIDATKKKNFPVLRKEKESISSSGDRVIKFFHDESVVSGRVSRAKNSPVFPNIISSSKNFYCYEFISGNVLSSNINAAIINDLIDWANDNLWVPVSVSRDEVRNVCMKFYKEKTSGRITDYLEKYNEIILPINGIAVPPISELIASIDWDYLVTDIPCWFHGDFILENILMTSDGSFTAIDWRQDFGGQLKWGDIYYDLAKMNHNLVVNHDIINRDMFKLEIGVDKIKCDILRSNNLVECQSTFREKVEKMGFDTAKMDLLTAIVWLNMASLHHAPFDQFLFYFGKLKLYNTLRKIGGHHG